MESAITTSLKFAFIVFVDHSKLMIDADDYQRLLNAMANPDIKSIKIGQNAYTIGGISKVLTLEEFYNEYPDQKPDHYGSSQDRDYDSKSVLQSDNISRNGLAALIRGMNTGIGILRAEGHEPKKAISERDRMVQKYTVEYGALPDELKISVVS